MSVNLQIVETLVKPRSVSKVARTKAGELATEITDWPEDWREVYEERAAIMEYDGNMPRPQAEQWAETIVRAAYKVGSAEEG